MRLEICAAPLLLQWAAGHPGLELALSLSDWSVDLIADGFDLAIRNGALKPDGALRARRRLTQRKLLCASRADLERRGRPVAVADLDSHDHLIHRRSDGVHPIQFEGERGQLVESSLKGRIRLDEPSVIVDAAVAGMGLAWVPSWLVQAQLAGGSLVLLLVQHRSSPLKTSAVWVARHDPGGASSSYRMRQRLRAGDRTAIACRHSCAPKTALRSTRARSRVHSKKVPTNLRCRNSSSGGGVRA